MPAQLPQPVLADPLHPALAPLRWRRTGTLSGDLWNVGVDRTDNGGTFYDPATSVSGGIDSPGFDLPFRMSLPGN